MDASWMNPSNSCLSSLDNGDSLNSFISNLSSSYEDHSPVQSSLNIAKHRAKSDLHMEKSDKREFLLVLLLQTICKQHNPTPDFFLSICKRLHDSGYLSSEKYKDLESLKQNSKNFILEILHTWPSTKKLKRTKSLDSVEDYQESPLNLPLFNILFYSRSRYKSDFTELECIGRGGFGKVFKTMHKVDLFMYAVKKIKFTFKSLKDLEATYHKLTREVKSLASLNHANIVNYNQSWFEPVEKTHLGIEDTLIQSIPEEDIFAMDSIEEETSEGGDILKFSKFSHVANESRKKSVVLPEDPKNVLTKIFSQNKNVEIMLYIQMQLCTTTTLEDWIWQMDRKVDIRQVYCFLDQILHGLAHIHSKHLIHRDVKPSNIFLGQDGVLKIGDFGLTTGAEGHVLHEKRTHGVGTTSYAAPEQLNGNHCDESCDIFSFGLIMFELFHPFKTKSERVQVFQDLKRGRISNETWKLYPKEMEIVKKCISLLPENRPSAVDLLDLISVDKDKIIREQESMIEQLMRKTREQEEEINKLKNKSL